MTEQMSSCVTGNWNNGHNNNRNYAKHSAHGSGKHNTGSESEKSKNNDHNDDSDNENSNENSSSHHVSNVSSQSSEVLKEAEEVRLFPQLRMTTPMLTTVKTENKDNKNNNMATLSSNNTTDYISNNILSINNNGSNNKGRAKGEMSETQKRAAVLIQERKITENEKNNERIVMHSQSLPYLNGNRKSKSTEKGKFSNYRF